MSRRILKHQRAKEDLINHFAYIAADKVGPAEHLLREAEALFANLALFPGMGRPWESDRLDLQDIRVIPIPKFRNYLVFYRATDRELRILAILHGRRDLPGLFETMDFGPLGE